MHEQGSSARKRPVDQADLVHLAIRRRTAPAAHLRIGVDWTISLYKVEDLFGTCVDRTSTRKQCATSLSRVFTSSLGCSRRRG